MHFIAKTQYKYSNLYVKKTKRIYRYCVLNLKREWNRGILNIHKLCSLICLNIHVQTMSMYFDMCYVSQFMRIYLLVRKKTIYLLYNIFYSFIPYIKIYRIPWNYNFALGSLILHPTVFKYLTQYVTKPIMTSLGQLWVIIYYLNILKLFLFIFLAIHAWHAGFPSCFHICINGLTKLFYI